MQQTKLQQNHVTDRKQPQHAAGGGLYCEQCVVDISACHYTGNTAALGGGAALEKAQAVTISHTTFSANIVSTVGASAAAPAGKERACAAGQEGSVFGGGGLFLESDDSSLSNLTFVSNTGSVAGEGRQATGRSAAALLSVQQGNKPGATVLLAGECSEDDYAAHSSVVASYWLGCLLPLPACCC
jgi:hypothetical protein